VANPLQHLRYFDGEYLRSYDFTDEQSYHIAMRRLMNLKLHLHGIVYGLEIIQDEDSVSGGPYFFSIAPGMGIDKTGREIIISAPYSLSNVLNGPGLSAGSYEVWICYREFETGLPAAGYLDCNAQNQNTRWQETFEVQLKPLSGPSLFKDCGGLRLGKIKLAFGSLGWEITPPALNVERTYVGIRAQRVIAPDEEKDTFDITAITTPPPDKLLPGYLDVHPGVFNRGNVVAKKNLVVGDDFVLNPAAANSKNLPGSIPASGNVKISGDLFLNGDFYGYSTRDGVWYSFAQYIQSFTPKMVVGPPITILLPTRVDTGSAPAPFSTVTSDQFVAFPGTPQVMLAITEMDWQDPKVLQTNWGGKGAVTVSVGQPAVNAAAPGFNTLNVVWNVGPVADVSPNWEYPVTKLVVSFVVIYQP
jgi:hypothetical protein